MRRKASAFWCNLLLLVGLVAFVAGELSQPHYAIAGPLNVTPAPFNLGNPIDSRKQRMKRLVLQSRWSNPLDNPLYSAGVTMTEIPVASADATLTKIVQPVTAGTVNPTDAVKFRFNGGTPTPFPAQAWYLFPVASVAPAVTGNLSGYLGGTPSLQAWSWEVEFVTDAPVVEINYLPASIVANTSVVVDNQYVTAKTGTVPGATGSRIIRLDFTAQANRAARDIRFRTRGPAGFGRVAVKATDSVSPPDVSDIVTVAVTGDSYTEGQGLTSNINPYGGWSSVFGDLLGWRDIRQVAVGSTGYLQNGGTRSTVRQQIPNWGFVPDAIVVAAGTNDQGNFTDNAIAAEAILAWRAMRAAAPYAPIFVVGPWAKQTGPSAAYKATETALNAAFLSWGDSNSYWIPMCTDPSPWQTGTGNVGATNGTGNGDFYLASDGVHPIDAGHGYIGRRFATAARSIIGAF